jgi:arginase
VPSATGVAERVIAIVGAPSSIGIRPYDGSLEPRRLDLAPGVLRGLGLETRLAADDLGDVTPPAYREPIHTPGRVRNEPEIADYSRALADRVARGVGAGHFVLVLGGDCSIVLGSLLGAGRVAGRIGLAYIDAHADFATAEESQTGSAASMCLALAVGRGDSVLARLEPGRPLTRGEDVVLIGRRDEGEPYGHEALEPLGVLDLPGHELSTAGGAATAAVALERIGREELDGFWIHVDVDVLDPRLVPAVDSPIPGGPDVEALTELLVPLVTHPRALGMQLTIYDPELDPGHRSGRRLATLLERVLGPQGMESSS